MSEELAPNRGAKLDDFKKLKKTLQNHDFYKFLECRDDGETNLKIGTGNLVQGKSAQNKAHRITFDTYKSIE